MIESFLYILSFLVTYYGVEYLRRWSISREILDVPNARSSHTQPTPSGGGLVFVIASLVSLLAYQIFYDQVILWSYFVSALLIAFISWLDDIYRISIILRFVCHIIAATLIIWQLGVYSIINLPYIGIIEFGWVGFIITLIWIVWMTNAYNFMDGIDGIAATQAITASIGWIFVGWVWNIDIYIFFGAVLFLTNVAFLRHNWNPAKIFMGDVGSAYLGFTLAIFPILAKFEPNTQTMNPNIFLISIMFVWLFFFDTFYTFISRVLKAEKVWQAHRSHIYQKLVISKYKHSTVSGLYGCISFVLITLTIYCLVVNDYRVLLFFITLMITATLVLFTYSQKMLTK